MKLPAYGKRLMELRTAGQYPDHHMVFGHLGWANDSRKKWAFVVPADADAKSLDLRFLAGLCLFFIAPLDQRHRALEVCKSAKKWAAAVQLWLTDAAGEVIAFEFVKRTGIVPRQVAS